jgi:sulfatase maturation enzyme AslB (radical SAM superfamily)
LEVCFSPATLGIYGFSEDKYVPIKAGYTAAITLESLKKIDRYRLEVSLACNLRCSYCVVHMNSVEQQNTLMSLNTAKAIVSRFNDEVGSSGSVFLMGGEPLLNIDVVRYIIDNIVGNTIIFTNAHSRNDELADYFYKHGTYILTSLDGSTLEQNEKRFHPDVKGNFIKVTNNIKNAIAKGCKVGVSCLLHSGNLTDAVEIATYFVEELKAKAMSFAYPHLTIKQSEENEFDIEAYGNQLIALFRFSKAKKVYIDQIGKIVSSILFNYPMIAGCKAGLSQRTFYPDGKETVCTKIDTCSDFNLDCYFSSLPYFNPKCSNCIAISLCGGGCAWDACVKAGNKNLDWRLCKYKIPVVKYIVNDILITLRQANSIDSAKELLDEIYMPMCNNYSEG